MRVEGGSEAGSYLRLIDFGRGADRAEDVDEAVDGLVEGSGLNLTSICKLSSRKFTTHNDLY